MEMKGLIGFMVHTVRKEASFFGGTQQAQAQVYS